MPEAAGPEPAQAGARPVEQARVAVKRHDRRGRDGDHARPAASAHGPGADAHAQRWEGRPCTQRIAGTSVAAPRTYGSPGGASTTSYSGGNGSTIGTRGDQRERERKEGS